MSSKYVELDDLNNIAQSIPVDKPIIMLNLLHFRKDAFYPPDSAFSACPGEAAYERYRKAFGKVVASLGITVAPIYVGQAHIDLVPANIDVRKWDMIALVKYPSFEDFRRIVESDGYIKDAKPHRLAALESISLLSTTELS